SQTYSCARIRSPLYNSRTHTARRICLAGCGKMSAMRKEFLMERFFRALADRTRLRILNLLGDDEVCVCFLVEILQTNQPNISRHLVYLRDAGIVSSRREGKWMHYQIVDSPHPHAPNLLRAVRPCLAKDKDMQRDRK